ncbi:MAG: tyrosine-protein phosphatase [Microthrixaceae bacterium]|nr:tyrosine-protein phosphatase [Microthrixaceae bacterium]MCO5313566.1 tyrosine-protein phosphatase [Microthrixaceae bacterium]
MSNPEPQTPSDLDPEAPSAGETNQPIPAIPGAFNLREFGGYRVAGGAIRPGLLYRSDLLNRVDPRRAHDWLGVAGVATLVDLRTEAERGADGFVESNNDMESIHRSLLDEVWSWRDEDESDSEWFLRDRTISMYEQHSDRIVVVLEDLVARDGAALFHCTAGKDRTGVVASALLGVLGASDEVIIADYSKSTEAMVGIVGWYRDRMIEQARAQGLDAAPPGRLDEEEIIRRAAAPATMRGVIDALKARHGSFEGWAVDIGVDRRLIDALRAKFVH